MPLRCFVLALSAAAFLILSGCGGSSGSGGGGGTGPSGPSISQIAPSSVMVGLPQSGFTLYGANFTEQSQVFVDGQAAMNTTFVNSGTLQADIDTSIDSVVGAHQFTVQESAGTSNAVALTVYAPQRGPLVMNAIPGYLVGNNEDNPPFVVVGDANGDGFADVLMPGPAINNTQNLSIAILDGNADGSLSPPVNVPTQAIFPIQALVFGDVNGDGNPDLVYVSGNNSSPNTIGVLLGDGHGNFQQTASLQTLTGLYPGPAFLADLDGDGKPDLVVSAENAAGITGSVFWLKNDGKGNFAPPITLATTGANRDFAVADFNRDGKPDIIYDAFKLSTGNDVLHILLNQGGGQFLDTLPPGLNGMGGQATVIDFNLDGVPDLVVQVPQIAIAMYSFSGNGDGSFTQVSSQTIGQPMLPAYQFVVGDFDHDGFPDLAGVNSYTEPSHILFMFGDGHGNFTPQEVVGPQGFVIATGDINGDGLPDVVVPDYFNLVSVALGRMDRNFPSALSLTPENSSTVSTGDINGDGLPEIFIAGGSNGGPPGTVFLNQGSSSFTFAATTDPSSFMVADLTGKGVVDLLGGSTGYLEIWPNNGSLDFSSAPITTQAPTIGPLIIADMDGDGHPDIVAAGQIFYGNGSYQFTAVATPNSFSAPYVVGNFTGNGMLDIAAGAVTFLNMGNRTFQQVTSNLPLVEGTFAVVADFNGDGKDDVAVELPGDASIAIYYSRGDGTFYQATVLDESQPSGTLAVADFNGDGRPDIAAGLELSHQVALFFNQGQGQFTRSFVATGASDSISMVAADLNGDGKPGLVIVNFFIDFVPPNVDVVFHK